MKHLKSKEIRQMWLDFFKTKGHSVEPSASLIPDNDPTLLWINAGVAPLKKYFDGRVVPDNHRITNAQKCIRTNDIENVGKTARHHTFFEMLGNFSIGDYFKEEAIEFACELLFSDKWFGFAKDKIYITYYNKDLVARDLWLRHGVAEDHLIPMVDNFWEIGEGPCGPDTEMFYDRGEKYDKRGKELIEQDIENDRFIEIWNIVFSQYNAKTGVRREEYQELPSKNIDTGCGLERLCCVMQEVDTNYDTDLFMPIIKKTEELANVKYNGQMAFKVIADHVRTVSFAIADGATLSNEGRGYVLRRVLRRAMKYAKQIGLNRPFMAELVDVVIEIMGDFYPQLINKASINTSPKNDDATASGDGSSTGSSKEISAAVTGGEKEGNQKDTAKDSSSSDSVSSGEEKAEPVPAKQESSEVSLPEKEPDDVKKPIAADNAAQDGALPVEKADAVLQHLPFHSVGQSGAFPEPHALQPRGDVVPGLTLILPRHLPQVPGPDIPVPVTAASGGVLQQDDRPVPVAGNPTPSPEFLPQQPRALPNL